VILLPGRAMGDLCDRRDFGFISSVYLVGSDAMSRSNVRASSCPGVPPTGMQLERDQGVSCARNSGTTSMPYILLWLLGIPIPVVILLALLWP
jgi:hypothetical protein